jgi:hypothetical protein
MNAVSEVAEACSCSSHEQALSMVGEEGGSGEEPSADSCDCAGKSGAKE